jgi:hypothetical protein
MALSKHEGAIFLLCVILCIEKDAELKGDVSKLLVFNYCYPVKIMKRFKNNISPDSRYVWYTYEPF